METSELIKALAADTRRTGLPMKEAWLVALAVAVLAAAALFFVLLGPRADAATSLQSARFTFKFVFTIALAVAALRLGAAIARPGSSLRPAVIGLLAVAALLGLSVLFELAATPADSWTARAIGTNSMVCLTFVPLMGLAPLAALLVAMRHGAPSHPTACGAIAGVLAGGISAAFYAAHCPDDSPLFVAVWYPLAIAMLASLGAVAGRLVLRW